MFQTESLDVAEKTFVREMIPYLESLLSPAEESSRVESERLRAFHILSRSQIRRLKEDEFWILQAHFGTDKLMAFQIELLSNFQEEIPESELSEIEKLCGFRGKRLRKDREKITAVLVPELMVQYEMHRKNINYDDAMKTLFQRSGHTIFFRAINEAIEEKRTSRRKPKKPRQVKKKKN